MEPRMAYTERFMMHTELYMLLTGKNARELTNDDMERIGRYLELDENRDRYFQYPAS